MALVAVFALAAIPRITYLLWFLPDFSGDYWDLSTSLLQHGTLALDGFRTSRYEPSYPLFIAGVRMLAPGGPIGVQAVQVALASLGGVWLYLTAHLLTGSRRVAWLAAALYAFHPLLVRHAADQSDSALITAGLLLFVYLFSRAATSTQFAACGACLGLVVLTRSMTLPLVAVSAILLMARRERAGAFALIVASLAVMSPMLIRNARLEGSLLPSRGGINLFIGNSPYTASLLPNHSPDILVRYADSIAIHALPNLKPDSPDFQDAADRVLGALAWSEMRAHPWATVILKIRNVFYFFSPSLVPSHLLTPDTSVILGPSGQATVVNAPPRPLSERIVFSLTSNVILVTALGGIVARRKVFGEDAILWCVLLTFVAVYSVYFPATRYEAPVAFVLLFYSAVGVDGGWRVLNSAPAYRFA